MKTGILFDLDGTLLDTLDDLTDATNYALSQFGCPSRSREELRRIVGNGALRQMTLALPGRSDDPDPQAVLAVYRPYYEAHCRIKTHPYPGVPDALAQVQEKHPVAIVSNKPDAAVKALCAEHFPGIFALGETADCPRKPAPDMLYRAMAQLGVKQAIYVGDSEVDVLTARNAGLPCLSVLWGFRDQPQLEDAGASFYCSDAAQMPQLLEHILGVYYGQ